jgi:MFS family permease
MIFTRTEKLITDITIPGTTVLLGTKEDVKELGLNSKEDSEIILFPQPSSDPNDPLNWPNWRKYLHFGILFLFSLILAAAANFTGPIYMVLAEVYTVTLNQMNVGGALIFLFLAVSCLLCQPFANKFGRRPIYLFTSLFAIVSAIIFSVETTYGGYIGYSIVIGFAVGPIDSLIEVSITDIFFLHQHGKYIGIYSLTLGLGSAFGPFIAGYATSNLGWQWCGYLLIIIIGGLLVVEIFFLEESLFKRNYDQPELDKKLLAVLSNTTNITDIKSRANVQRDSDEKNVIIIKNESTTINEINGATIPKKTFIERMKPFVVTEASISPFSLLKTLQVLRYPAVSWTAFIYGIQIWWLSLITVSESQFFMAPPYNFSPDSLGLLSLGMVVGAFIGGTYAAFSDKFQIFYTKKNNGIFEPEFRLLMLPIPIFLNVSGLLMYGLGPYYGVHWVVGAIGIVFISASLSSITSLSINYVLECYPKQAAASMSSVLVVRNLIGMVFTFVFQYWLNNVGPLGTTIMLAVFAFAFNLTFLIMFAKGKDFRKYTQKWYEDAK